MRGLVLAVSTAAALLFAPATAASDNCGPIKGFSLALEPTEDGYLVPLAVAGTPHRFLLRFEEAYSKLDEAVAANLDLPLKSLSPYMGVKDSQGRFTKIATAPTIGVGPIVRNNAEFLIGVHRSGWGVADGVAGLNVFYGLDAELDVKHNRLGLYLPRECGFTLFWTAEFIGDAKIEMEPTGGFHMPMRLDGQVIDVKMSTSSARTYMPLSAARILFGIEKGNPALIPAGTRDGGESLYRFPFKALTGGDKVTVQNPEILIYENREHQCGGKADRRGYMGEQNCWGGGDLELGTNLLSKLHLFFAFKEKKVYFTLSEPAAGKAEERPAP